MEPELVTEWIVLVPDNAGTLETRMKVRGTHVREMLEHIDSGLFQMGGATLDDGSIAGSAIIARAKSESEVVDVLKRDIYARSGVWDMDKLQLIPFKCVYRRSHVDRAVMGDTWRYEERKIQ